MHILVAVASRHGSTHEIASALAQQLRLAGHAVDVRRIEFGPIVEPYDAIIIGSAIYMGDWLPEAREFVDHNWVKLSSVPVWLFSSGPLGHEHPQPTGDPTHLQNVIEKTAARGHQRFVGKLDKRSLGMGERLITRVVGAPEGDFRDWEAISNWGDQIGAALNSTRSESLVR